MGGLGHSAALPQRLKDWGFASFSRERGPPSLSHTLNEK